MIKKILSRSTLLCVAMLFSWAQAAIAQQESAERELQVVSFSEADANDDDTRKPSNFEGKLKTTALVKVFMPGEIETTVPTSGKDIERRLTRGGTYAYYVWIEEHTNIMRIVPKGNLYKTVEVKFTKWNIPMYSLRNKNGGLQAGKVYQLVLHDPTPVYIDTYLPGAYAYVDDNSAQKINADKDGRITLTNLSYGEHLVKVFASDGSVRGSVTIDDSKKMYSLDARKKTTLSIKTNPLGGQIFILDGESKETYNPSKEYAYGSYKVIALINGNTVEKNITVDERHNSFTIDNTKTYNLTPMYMGSSTTATVYENNKQLVEGEDNGVLINGNTYQVTRPIDSKYKYYATNHWGKSRKTTINVTNSSQTDYQLSIAARNSIVWPWQREYDAAPMGVAVGYVQKQMVTEGEGEKLKENGVWTDGVDKWLHGFQVGFYAQPCFSWGLGLYTGLFYEVYFSSNSSDAQDEYENFQEHNLTIPIHALYRLPLGRKCCISLHGGLGLSYAVYGSYSADGYEDYTDFYGEEYYPKRFNIALEGGIDFRLGPVQVGFVYSKGLNDHKSYSSLGDYKTTYKKIGLNIAWVVGAN